jgi:hypothetical protein
MLCRPEATPHCISLIYVCGGQLVNTCFEIFDVGGEYLNRLFGFGDEQILLSLQINGSRSFIVGSLSLISDILAELGKFILTCAISMSWSIFSAVA